MKTLLILLPLSLSLFAIEQEAVLTIDSARDDQHDIKGIESTLEYSISKDLNIVTLKAAAEVGHSKVSGTESDSDFNTISISIIKDLNFLEAEIGYEYNASAASRVEDVNDGKFWLTLSKSITKNDFNFGFELTYSNYLTRNDLNSVVQSDFELELTAAYSLNEKNSLYGKLTSTSTKNDGDIEDGYQTSELELGFSSEFNSCFSGNFYIATPLLAARDGKTIVENKNDQYKIGTELTYSF